MKNKTNHPNKVVKTIISIFGALIIAVTAFHFWFVNHAEKVISDLVASQSNGKLALTLDKFKYNWLTNKIGMESAHFTSTDTTISKSYRVDVSSIDIKTEGFLPMLFRKQFKIDSIHFYNPHLSIIKKSSPVKLLNLNDISIPQEIGKISDAINSAISLLKINRFIIENGSFSINQKNKKTLHDFAISNIDIHLDNLTIDSTSKRRERREKKFLFSDNIAIKTTNQHIVLPNNTHVIDFKNFSFNIKNKLVAFDSCTIRANKGDSSRTSFKVFFDKLQLTNINFDTLYHSGTLVADSVFCNTPDIVFNIDKTEKHQQLHLAKSNNNIATAQKIDQVLQQLLGDIYFKHIIVKDADVGIIIYDKDIVNKIETANTNFEILDFKASQNSLYPIQVSSFDLGLKDYAINLQNDKYAISFDSLHLEEDGLVINQLKFKEKKKSEVVTSAVIPSVHLTGLSWEDLLYHQQLKAQTGIFQNPDINIVINNNQLGHKKNDIEILQLITKLVQIPAININNGNFHFNIAGKSNIDFRNTNINVLGADVLKAQSSGQIQHIFHDLKVDSIVYKTTNARLLLQNVFFDQHKKNIKASGLLFHSDKVNAVAKNIEINNLLLSEDQKKIKTNALSWETANVNIDKTDALKKNVGASLPQLFLENINLSNTNFKFKNDNTALSLVLPKLRLSKFDIDNNQSPNFNDLYAEGKEFNFDQNQLAVNGNQFLLNNNRQSVFNDVHVQYVNNQDAINAAIPKIEFTTYINKLLSNHFTFDNVLIANPSIIAATKVLENKTANISKPQKDLIFDINNMRITTPNILWKQENKNGIFFTYQSIGKNKSSVLELNNIFGNFAAKFAIEKIGLLISDFSILKNDSLYFSFKDNIADIKANDFIIERKDSSIDWRLLTAVQIQNPFQFNNVGGKANQLNITIDSIQNINVTNQNINHWRNIILQSPKLKIYNSQGDFTNTKNKIKWNGLRLDSNHVEVKNTSFEPLQSLDDYLIKKAFNADYSSFTTGKIKLNQLDVVQLLIDSSLNVKDVVVDSLYFLSAKDKTQIDSNTKEKLFPVQLLSQLNLSININDVNFTNGFIKYMERQPITLLMGIVNVSDVHGNIRNLKNINSSLKDSLYINANGNINQNLLTHLEVIQPYKNPMLIINTTTDGIELTSFNNILIPLTGATLKSGYLKQLKMNAVADNQTALGHTSINYSGLVIVINNKNDVQHQSSYNKIVSWIINNFVVKNNNNGVVAPFVFERIKTKSFLNYIIKSNISGIANAAGIPGTKKKLKRYKKAQNKLPAEQQSEIYKSFFKN